MERLGSDIQKIIFKMALEINHADLRKEIKNPKTICMLNRMTNSSYYKNPCKTMNEMILTFDIARTKASKKIIVIVLYRYAVENSFKITQNKEEYKRWYNVAVKQAFLLSFSGMDSDLMLYFASRISRMLY